MTRRLPCSRCIKRPRVTSAGPATYTDDPEQTAKASEAARAETEQVLAELGGSRPPSVTVKAV